MRQHLVACFEKNEPTPILNIILYETEQDAAHCICNLASWTSHMLMSWLMSQHRAISKQKLSSLKPKSHRKLLYFEVVTSTSQFMCYAICNRVKNHWHVFCWERAELPIIIIWQANNTISPKQNVFSKVYKIFIQVQIFKSLQETVCHVTLDT